MWYEDNDGGNDIDDIATLSTDDVDDMACPLMRIMMMVMIWPPCLQMMLMLRPHPLMRITMVVMMVIWPLCLHMMLMMWPVP